jgi:hypothetical protein
MSVNPLLNCQPGTLSAARPQTAMDLSRIPGVPAGFSPLMTTTQPLVSNPLFDTTGFGATTFGGSQQPLFTNTLLNPAMFTPTVSAATLPVQQPAGNGTEEMMQQIAGTVFSLIKSIVATAQKGEGEDTPAITAPKNRRTTGGGNTEKPDTGNLAPPGSLQDSLEAIASDADGAKLIEAAKAKGVKIEVGNPETAAGEFDVVSECPSCKAGIADGHGGSTVAKDGTTQVNGVTLSNSQTGEIRIVVRDPSNIKTIAHELVHAVSTDDGNSKQEEGIADVIGSRVANRLGGSNVGGLSGSEREIFTNKQQFYPNLKSNNSIRETLAGLGLSVSV